MRPPTEKTPVSPLGFTHHGYAELLAAEYIQALTLEQLVSLLTVPAPAGKRVPPQLVEVASWLAITHDQWFHHLLDIMPEILLRSDGGQFTTVQKHKLTEALLTRVSFWDAAALEETRLLTPSFKFNGLADQLRPIILNSNAAEMARLFAIEVAAQCRMTELEQDLWSLLERKETKEPRHHVIHALFSILKGSDLSERSLERLTSALRLAVGADKDDELKGMALFCLVPRYLAPAQAAAHLTIPKRDFYFGSYKRALNDHLPPLISGSDVEEFLVQRELMGRN